VRRLERSYLSHDERACLEVIEQAYARREPITPREIAERLGWAEAVLQDELLSLVRSGWLRLTAGGGLRFSTGAPGRFFDRGVTFAHGAAASGGHLQTSTSGNK